MISKNEIREQLSTWMATELEPWIDQILPIAHHKWGDAIDTQIPSLEQNRRPNIRPSLGVYARIFSLLGHIAVNPSVAHNSRVLRRSYALTKDARHVNNANEVSTFIDDLCARAEAQRAKFIDYQQSHLAAGDSAKSTDAFGTELVNRSNFSFLVGDRGIGKTFFLNFLLTKYSSTFDSRRVIWVRLNLVEDFGVDNNLLHWTYAQIAKIVLRYYDPKSTFYKPARNRTPIPAFDHLINFAKELPVKPSSYDLEEKLIGLLQEYIRNQTDDPISPELCPIEIGREVFSFAVACGYSFIIVFDGLDRLELIQKARDKFDVLAGYISRLQNTDEKLTSTFLIVCRTETFSLFGNGSAYSLDTSQYYELGSVSIEDVLTKRFTMILAEILRGLKTKKEKQEIVTHLGAFVTFLVRDKTIAEMFARNRRAAMQAIQYRYLDFLRDLHIPGGYHITESLMKMGHAYPPVPYVYYLADEFAETYERLDPQKSMDNRLLPSVFTYPHLPYTRSTRAAPCRDGMVLGIRILQIALAYAQVPVLRKASTLSSRDIADLLSVLFAYDRSIALTQIEDFGEFEFLRTVGANTPRPVSAESYEVSIMPKGEKIVREYLSESTYLALGVMRTPFQSLALLKQGGRPGEHTLVLAATTESPLGFERWISAKVVNAINARRLLKYFHASHERMFKANLGAIALPHLRALAQRAESFMFPNEEQGDRAVLEQLERVFSSLEQVDVTLVDRVMERTRRAFVGWS